jgi:NAD(P)-dependent dehydrogenase (short-subunit alcohol dehydrogenase family)
MARRQVFRKSTAARHRFEGLARPRAMTSSIAGKKVVVVGGSRGLGLGMVEALVTQGARVSVVARGPAALAEVSKRLPVEAIEGDATEASLAERVLSRVRPEVLILNAGVTPSMGGLRELSWESFSSVWNADVKSGFQWVQAALRLPLATGSRVLLGSSGAAIGGALFSGGYSGAKRMLWLMAQYANVEAQQLGLGIHFQAILPLDLVSGTDVGHTGAEYYARQKGVRLEEFWAGYASPLSAAEVGQHVATILSDPAYANGVAFGLKGGVGITSLDPKDSA